GLSIGLLQNRRQIERFAESALGIVEFAAIARIDGGAETFRIVCGGRLCAEGMYPVGPEMMAGDKRRVTAGRRADANHLSRRQIVNLIFQILEQRRPITALSIDTVMIVHFVLVSQ